MKLSHLSLAIFSAIALSACGGSSTSGPADDGMNDKKDKIEETDKGGNDDQNKEEEKKEEEKVTEEEKKEDQEIVDATKDEVVDAIALSKEQTYASQQYIRSKKSKHDRIVNPDKGDASTTVLSGVTLDVQNPQLTNIVVARVVGKNAKGEDVKISQYAGSELPTMESLDTTTTNRLYDSLQRINRPNSLVAAKYGVNTTTGVVEVESGYGDEGYVDWNLYDFLATVKNTPNFLSTYENYLVKKKAYEDKVEEFKAKGPQGTDVNTVAPQLQTATDELETAISTLKAVTYGNYLGYDIAEKTEKVKLLDKTQFAAKANDAAWTKPLFDAALASTAEFDFDNFESNVAQDLTAYGYGLYRPFFNQETLAADERGFGDEYIASKKEVKGTTANNTNPDLAAPTHGLVGMYNLGRQTVVRGLEDNNVRTSRIFGHYYLDPGAENNELQPEVFNSWNGAATYITGLDADGSANKWSLGAAPVTLDHVQYGRVTAKIDEYKLQKEAGTSGWDYRHQQTLNRDPKKEKVADDFYFYRGTGATKIEDMAKLPTDAKINYAGHALMYGIDNKFHGKGQNLPNAFGHQQSYGLGNFVKGELDMAENKFSGEVYNVWHRVDNEDGVEDTLVTFSGDVKGNTVVGNAERAYMDETNPAIFRASFYGANAAEVGGAFNAVTNEEVYSDTKDNWGGVFGAQRTSSGGSSWLVSSEKK